jgi:hypothetical protein
MTTPPQPGILSKIHEGKQYNWCSKCRQGKGLWVLRHTTTTHVDGYRRPPKRHASHVSENDANRPKYEHPNPVAHYSDLITEIPSEPHAQLSLNDYLDAYFEDPNAQN